MSSVKSKAPSYQWDERRELLYLSLLIDNLSKRINNQWPPSFSTLCIEKFEAEGLPPPTPLQLNSKRSSWGSTWRVWYKLYCASGWGFDESTGMLTASEETWEAAIAADPEGRIRGFRKRPLKYRQQLEQIFSETQATGEYIHGPDDPLPAPGPVPRQEISDIELSTDASPMESSSGRDIRRKDKPPVMTPRYRRVKAGKMIEHYQQELLEAVKAVSEKITEKKTPQDAINLLDDEYGDNMEAEEYLKAIEIVTAAPEIFCSLKTHRRTEWLETQLAKGL